MNPMIMIEGFVESRNRVSPKISDEETTSEVNDLERCVKCFFFRVG